jgi:hypothetical protein
LPPSVPVRRWDEALWLGGFVGASAYSLSAWALARPLPLFGPSPASLGSLLLAPLHGRALLDAPLPLSARVGVMLGCAALLGGWAFVAGLKPQVRLKHLSGPRLLEGKDAEEEARYQARKERGGAEAGFLRLHLALDLPKSRWTRHLLVYGSVGSGKTVILTSVLQQAMAKKLKAFVFDVKGDFTARFPRAALVSPWHADSRVWDIAADVRTPSQAATFAQAFIPEGEGSNRYFSLAAQQLLVGALRALQNERGRSWGWRDLASRLATDRAAFAALLAEHYPKAAPLLGADDSSATASVLATLAAHTKAIDDLAAAWGNNDEKRKSVSLRHWVRDDFNGRRQIIVQAGPDASLTSAYIGAMIRLLESFIIAPTLPDDEQGRTLLFLLDELPSLRVDVSALVDKGRSKGVIMIMGLQSLTLLRDAIGPNKTLALPSMVGTHVVCRLQMGEDRDQVAGLFGRERLALTAVSQGTGGSGPSGSVAAHEETRAVVDPSVLSSELGVVKKRRKDWPHGYGIRALVSLGGDALMLDYPGIDRAPVIPFKSAAWTQPVRQKVMSEETSAGETEQERSEKRADTPRAAAVAALAARFAKEHRIASDPLGGKRRDLDSERDPRTTNEGRGTPAC